MKKTLLSLLISLPLSLAAQWNLTHIIDDTTYSNQYFPEVLNAQTILMIPTYSYNSEFIKKSIDGGVTWSDYMLDATFLYTLINEVTFVNDQIGYMVGGTPYGTWNAIAKTIDGGETWAALDNSFLEFSGYSINHVAFPTVDTGYIGTENSVYKTTDGGTSFAEMTIPNSDTSYPMTVTDIHFINSEIGFIATAGFRYVDTAYHSQILKTMDGGESWELVNSENWHGVNLWYQVDKIQFVNANTGFAIGMKGVLQISNDGGNNWSEKALPYVDAIPSDMSFVNNACGYIVINHQIFRTNDAGNNWTLQTIDNDTNMVDYIQFTNDSVGYAVGAYYLYVNPFSSVLKTVQAPNAPLIIPTIPFQEKLKIYPNPTKDWIMLSYDNNLHIESIQLLDMLGRTVRVFDKDVKRLNVSGIASGMYLLNIQTREGTVHKKIMLR